MYPKFSTSICSKYGSLLTRVNGDMGFNLVVFSFRLCFFRDLTETLEMNTKQQRKYAYTVLHEII